MRQHVVVAALLLALAACQKTGTAPESAAVAAGDADFAAKLHERLLDAKPGDVIEIPAGKFSFDRSLTLRADGVTIRGAGMDKSVLSFKGQKAGAEGLLVNGNDFTIENLAIEDSKGDGLKISEVEEHHHPQGASVQWTGGPSTKNGAYGLYPVQTQERADRGLGRHRRLRRRHLRGPVRRRHRAPQPRRIQRGRHRDREHHQRRRLRERGDRRTPAASWCSTCPT